MTQPPGPGPSTAGAPLHPTSPPPPAGAPVAPESAPQPFGVPSQPSGVPFVPVPAPVPPPGPDGQWQPARIDPVAGTEYGLVQLRVPSVASGLATGALIAGIASVLVSVLVLCFGLVGSGESWGGWVAGAFTLLAVLIGGGAVAVGLVATRQIRRSGAEGRLRFTGRGTAVAGISCGAAGAGIALLSLLLTLVLQFS